MTTAQALKQSADYRAAAEGYAASGDARAAEFLTELASRIDATARQQAAKIGAA